VKKYDPNEKLDKEQMDALEYYMKKCHQLEQQVGNLKERVKLLEWQAEEKD